MDYYYTKKGSDDYGKYAGQGINLHGDPHTTGEDWVQFNQKTVFTNARRRPMTLSQVSSDIEMGGMADDKKQANGFQPKDNDWQFDDPNNPAWDEVNAAEEEYDELSDESNPEAVWTDGPPAVYPAVSDRPESCDWAFDDPNNPEWDKVDAEEDDQEYDELSDESNPSAVWVDGPPDDCSCKEMNGEYQSKECEQMTRWQASLTAAPQAIDLQNTQALGSPSIWDLTSEQVGAKRQALLEQKTRTERELDLIGLLEGKEDIAAAEQNMESVDLMAGMIPLDCENHGTVDEPVLSWNLTSRQREVRKRALLVKMADIVNEIHFIEIFAAAP